MLQDSKGFQWSRSEDRIYLICEDGRSIQGCEEMTDEYLLSVAEMSYLESLPIKNEADRIAELEAQVKALLAKLS
jgi:hypothetical protein